MKPEARAGLAVRDVADETQEQVSLSCLQGAAHYVNEKLFAVLVFAAPFEPHIQCSALMVLVVAKSEMHGTELFRKQYLNGLAAQFVTAVPKEPFNLYVDANNAPLLVGNHNGFRNRLEQSLEDVAAVLRRFTVLFLRD
jgi:hypothetical protein